MALPEPKKPFYTLREVATKWDCEIDDLFYYAEEPILQICKLQANNVPDIFLTDEDEIKDDALRCQQVPIPIPIDHHEARELYKSYKGNIWDRISLVITYEEKERFDKKYHLTKDGGQAENNLANQKQGTSKKELAALTEVAQKLSAVEMDEDVVAARLREEYGAKDWQIRKILDIAPHLENEKSRNRAALRSAERGKNTLNRRAKVN